MIGSPCGHPGARSIWATILTVAVLLAPIPAWADQPGAANSARVLLPSIRRSGGSSNSCAPISTMAYGARPVSDSDSDRPAEAHADKNLALRGYARTSNTLALIEYDGGSDSRAPQLRYLFADQRAARFSAVYQVYEWNWDGNRRGPLLTRPPVTLAGLVAKPGEPVYTPRSGYDIGEGYQALALYASPERITLKYTAEDNVVRGYTIHLEGVCVDPALLALYRRLDAEGRRALPALHGGEAIGRAQTAEVSVVVRDNGAFMDPRSRKDWWQNP